MKKMFLMLATIMLVGCNNSPTSSEEQAPTVVEQTVIVVPDYYAYGYFERYYNTTGVYEYTPTGTKTVSYGSEISFVRYNIGSNKDIVLNSGGTSYNFINIGKIPDRYYGSVRCSCAKFKNGTGYVEVGICSDDMTIFWFNNGYIALFNE